MGLSIEIYNEDWVRQGYIDDIEYLALRHSFSDINYSEMKISKKAQCVDLLVTGARLVVFDTDRTRDNRFNAFYIEEVNKSLNELSVSFVLAPLKAILSRRICGNTQYVFDGNSQGYIMTHLVNINANDTLGIDPKRNMTELWVDTSTISAGVSPLYYQSDFEPLSEALTDLALASTNAMGWNVTTHESTPNVINGFTYFGYLPTDRSINQSGNFPIVFSDESNHFDDVEYIQSEKGYKNVAYGVGKVNAPVSAISMPSGSTRYETRLTSNKRTRDAQRIEIRSELRRRGKTNSFVVDLSDDATSDYRYGVSYNLGDIVTVRIKEWALEFHPQITEVEEIYQGAEYSIHLTFGDPSKTINGRIKNTIRDNHPLSTRGVRVGDVAYSGSILLDGQANIQIATEDLEEAPNGLAFHWHNVTTGVDIWIKEESDRLLKDTTGTQKYHHKLTSNFAHTNGSDSTYPVKIWNLYYNSSVDKYILNGNDLNRTNTYSLHWQLQGVVVW